MNDDVSICNYALAKFGVSPIMDMDDESKQAQFCKRLYEPTRDGLLQGHLWKFAMRRASLNMLADKPDFEWNNAFSLPVDCLRVVQMNGYYSTERPGEFAIEGLTLLTNASRADIRYISNSAEPKLFHPLFAEALALKLAAALAGPIAGSHELAKSFLAELENITGPKARLMDAFEQRRRRKVLWSQSDLVAARYA